MHHSQATVATKQAPVRKARAARSLSNPDVIGFSFMDALMSADAAIKARRTLIDSLIEEHNAMVRFRRNLKTLRDTVAA